MSTMNRFPTGGGSSDIATAEPNNVLKGYTFVGKDSDDIQTGTLELTGSAVKNHVIKGATFYDKDAKTKITGTMEVGNVSSLNLAVSSGRNITITWSNPTQATGRPYSGVYIKYSTSGNPGTGGTQIYKGTGNNTTSGGRSSVTLGFPNLGTRYYISVYSYCVTSNGELKGTPIQGNIVSGSTYTQTITSSRNVTVPSGYSKVDIFCVGGGASGKNGNSGDEIQGSAGGGGGYTTTASNIAVSSGQVLVCSIGAGAIRSYQSGRTGGTTTVKRNGTTLCSANGGKDQDGGSGGADGGLYSNGANGGSNGGNSGVPSAGGGIIGKGQGRTTRPFGESSGTAYSGGGGGGGSTHASTQYYGGSGGTTGGGQGGAGWVWRTLSTNTNGGNGSANTGGGGGGAGTHRYWVDGIGESAGLGGNGGSGIILIRFK